MICERSGDSHVIYIFSRPYRRKGEFAVEKKKNEAESERKSDTSLKGTVIAFIILLILAIAAFLCEKMDNAIFTILMVIISVITFFGTVI